MFYGESDFNVHSKWYSNIIINKIVQFCTIYDFLPHCTYGLNYITMTGFVHDFHHYTSTIVIKLIFHGHPFWIEPMNAQNWKMNGSSGWWSACDINCHFLYVLPIKTVLQKRHTYLFIKFDLKWPDFEIIGTGNNVLKSIQRDLLRFL